MAKAAKIFHQFASSISVLFVLFTLVYLLFIYRGVIFSGKIAFPGNYLVSFFAPWSTEKQPGWEHGVPFKPVGTDQIRFFYPGRTFSNEALASGKLPLWNPYIFSGNPHLADYQSAVFYPLNILYLLLPQLTAWTILTMATPFLGFIFCFVYLGALKISKTAAFLGAFSFGFSGFILTWSQEAFAVTQCAVWLPLILFGIEKYFQTFSKRYLLVSSLALAMSLLAGYLQLTVYISILAVVYVVYRFIQIDKQRVKVSLLLLMSAMAFAGLLAAVQILPSLEGFFQSPRPTVKIDKVFDTYLLSPAFLLHAVAPDIDGNPATNNYSGRGSYNETALYIGVAPLIFALLALLKFRKERLVRFFSGSAVVSFVLTSNLPFVREFLNLPWPLIPTFQPSRILLITTLSLSTLTAIGFDRWKKMGNAGTKTIWMICLVIGGILATTTAWHSVWFIHNYSLLAATQTLKPLAVLWKSTAEYTALKNILLPLTLLGLTALVALPLVPRKLAVAGIIALTLFSQFYFFNKYLGPGEKQFLYPQEELTTFISQRQDDLSRFVALGKPVFGNIPTQMKLYSPEGFDPIFSKRYGQLVRAAMTDGQLSEDIPRIEVNLSDLPRDRWGNYLSLATKQKELRLLSLLGVRTVAYFPDKEIKVGSGDIFPLDLFTTVATVSGWQVLSYNQALPRAFLAENVVVETAPQKILDQLFKPDFDPAKTVVLEKKPVWNSSSTVENFDDQAGISNYESEEVTVNTRSFGPRVLFLSDNYYPGWKVTVDGKPAEIFRADFSFRAVPVSSGEHVVQFVYQPESVKAGIVITLASLGLLGIFLAGMKLRNVLN